MKKILIWGTQERGRRAYNFLEGHPYFEVIGFGDQNMDVVGCELFGKPIVGIDDLQKMSDLDAIVFTLSRSNDILAWLHSVTNVKIYSRFDELFIKNIFLEISGNCNAKCKWCVTGQQNRCNSYNRHTPPGGGKYADLASFEKMIYHLLETKLIEKGTTTIELYNWGEPMLNPDFPKIISFLSSQGVRFAISTNASIVPQIRDIDSYKYCTDINFSMPGFSQMSYDKIHGFNFERIKNNMIKILYDARKSGFEGRAVLNYHIYKFNTEEIIPAISFANAHGLEFGPKYAYLNGSDILRRYFSNNVSVVERQEIDQDLFMSDQMSDIKEVSSQFRCNLADYLVIDWDGTILTCCMADEREENKWGNIHDVQCYEEWLSLREKILASKFCCECKKQGIAYWLRGERNVDLVKALNL